MVFVIGYMVLYMSLNTISESLLAYDCSHRTPNFTRISLLDIAECQSVNKVSRPRSEEVQLVELKDSFTVKVQSCIVTVTRLIYKCTGGSKIYPITHGLTTYVLTLGKAECITAHTTGSLVIRRSGFKPIGFHGLKDNISVRKTHTIAGWTDDSGYCGTGFYSDPFGTWTDVTVLGDVTVVMSSYEAQVTIKTDSIHLRSSVSCTYSEESCIDLEIGESYWNRLDEDSCKSNLHRVLYEGGASIMSDNTTDMKGAIASVRSNDILFSLQLVKPYSICNLDAWTTEHPKLVIIRKAGSGFFYKKSSQKDIAGLDMFTYMNSKFVYLERNIETNFNDLWSRVKGFRCEMERSILEHMLTTAKSDPPIFAYNYMRSRGYTAMTLGEVTYITQCQAVGVSYRKSENCYNELPVFYKNMSFFMTPKTRLLQRHGNQIECSPLMTAQYKLEGKWWSTDKILRETSAPLELSSTRIDEWRFTRTEELATAGIYSQDDLDLLRDHLMFGSEREALVTILSRGYDGKDTDFQGGSLLHMMSEEEIQSLGSKIWKTLWSWMSTFGNISAGVIGIMMIIRIIKWLVDTIIHGRALYEIYGFSIFLLASIWDALTMFLIHRNGVKKPANEDVELGPLNTQSDTNKIAPSNTSTDNTIRTEVKSCIYPSLPDRRFDPAF